MNLRCTARSPRPIGSIHSPHPRHVLPRGWATAATLTLASACSLPDRMPTGGDASGRVGVSLQASVVAVGADAINARVFYVRTTGGRNILIDSTAKIDRNSSGGVSWTGTRGFPFEFDLAPCLVDKAHVVAGSGCLVGIAVRLTEGGALRDSIDIEPTQVEPGHVTVITRTIVLREIQSVTVTGPSSAIEVGASLPLGARVVDVAGTTLTDRSVDWQSSAPAIAHVSGDGVLTALAPGEATIVARAGGREGTVRVLVAAKAP